MDDRFRRAGTYNDVAAIPGGFAWAWSGLYDSAAGGALLHVERYTDQLTSYWWRLLPEDLLFVRAAASPAGTVAVVGKGHTSGQLWFVVQGKAVPLGPSHGQDVCVIQWDRDTFKVWVVVDTTTYAQWILTEAGVVIASATFSLDDVGRPSTSQGIRDVAPDGTLLWGDPVDSSRYTIRGRTLTRAHRVGGVCVGEKNEGGVGLALAWEAEERYVTVFEGGGQPPNVAVNGEAIAVCAYTTRGAELAIFTPPYPDNETVPIVAIDRPQMCGFFAFGPERTTAPLPGNCRLLVPELTVVANDGRLLGQYVASEGAGLAQDLLNLEAAIRTAHAARPGVPVIAYWTRGAQAVRVPAGADIVGVEAYRPVDWSLARFEEALRAALARCPAAVVIAQCYTQNTKNHPDIASLVPVYARVARDCPNVIGTLAFSGIGRDSGLQDHPEVRPLWEQFAAGIPGLPAKGDEFVEPFKIRIKDDGWGKTIKAGQDYHAFADIGNGLEVEFQKDAKDELHIAVYRNGELQDRSGAPRKVKVVG